jgi:hypothetical protein
MSKKSKTTGGPVSLMRVRARALDAVILEIAQAIAHDTWKSGELAEELQERMGVGPDAIRKWSAEAARMLRIGPDVEAYRALNIRRLDEIASTGDDRDRISAMAEQNKMLGLHAPTKVSIDVTAYAKLEPPQMLEAVDRQIAELQELRARLVAKQSVAELSSGPVVDVEVDLEGKAR